VIAIPLPYYTMTTNRQLQIYATHNTKIPANITNPISSLTTSGLD
jgi:hypothetical protein